MLVIFKDEEVNEESVGRLDESRDAGDKKGQGMSSRTGAWGRGGLGNRRTEAFFQLTSLMPAIGRPGGETTGIKECMCKRRNDSKAFQWPHFLQYLSSCPHNQILLSISSRFRKH